MLLRARRVADTLCAPAIFRLQFEPCIKGYEPKAVLSSTYRHSSNRRMFWRSAMRATCSECAQANDEESRYCTRCGSILKPIFCSICGTPNPSGLGTCLQCGTALPDMSGIRWAPSVTVLRPTDAMTKKTTAASNESSQ